MTQGQSTILQRNYNIMTFLNINASQLIVWFACYKYTKITGIMLDVDGSEEFILWQVNVSSINSHTKKGHDKHTCKCRVICGVPKNYRIWLLSEQEYEIQNQWMFKYNIFSGQALIRAIEVRAKTIYFWLFFFVILLFCNILFNSVNAYAVKLILGRTVGEHCAVSLYEILSRMVSGRVMKQTITSLYRESDQIYFFSQASFSSLYR